MGHGGWALAGWTLIGRDGSRAGPTSAGDEAHCNPDWREWTGDEDCIRGEDCRTKQTNFRTEGPHTSAVSDLVNAFICLGERQRMTYQWTSTRSVNEDIDRPRLVHTSDWCGPEKPCRSPHEPPPTSARTTGREQVSVWNVSETTRDGSPESRHLHTSTSQRVRQHAVRRLGCRVETLNRVATQPRHFLR